MANDGAAGGRRETRLLLATIAVSVGMLFLLARFRFPEEAARQTVEPAPAPLERLAARATFDELAGIMADLERRILPAVSTVAGQGDDGTVTLPAIRMTPDRAVALMPGEIRLTSTNGNGQPTIVLRDAVRDLVVVEPAPRPDAAPAVPATGGRPGPRYVAVVEAPGGVPAVRPVYVGRTDLLNDPRWSEPLLRVAAVQQTISAGSAIFSLDGAFIGLATPGGARVTIVPASTLRNVAVTAQPAQARSGDLPFQVQPLTAELARAAGAKHGVMISHVGDPRLPVASGDVVQSIDGTTVTTIGGYQAIVQSRTAGVPVKIDIVRRGTPQVVTVTAIEAGAAQRPASDGFGAVLRAVAGAGVEVVAVDEEGPAHRAGIRRGDFIVGADGATLPDPGAVLRLYRDAGEGEALLLTLLRDGVHRVVAVEKR